MLDSAGVARSSMVRATVLDETRQVPGHPRPRKAEKVNVQGGHGHRGPLVTVGGLELLEGSPAGEVSRRLPPSTDTLANVRLPKIMHKGPELHRRRLTGGSVRVAAELVERARAAQSELRPAEAEGEAEGEAGGVAGGGGGGGQGGKTIEVSTRTKTPSPTPGR